MAPNRTKNAADDKTNKSKTPRAARSKVNEAVEEFDMPESLLDETAKLDIAGVVLATFAAVSFLAVIVPSDAPVTSALATFFHSGFGLGAYVLPAVLLLLSAVLLAKKESPLDLRTTLGSTLIFLSIITGLSLARLDWAPNLANMDPQFLSETGGYVGCVIASAFISTLGKTPSFIVLVAIGIIGFVILGFSLSDLIGDIMMRFALLRERRQVSFNETPWGDSMEDADDEEDEALSSLNPAERIAARHRARKSDKQREDSADQSQLFDADDAALTTYLGDRKTTLMLDDQPEVGPDYGEDPFVDVSDQLEEEQHAQEETSVDSSSTSTFIPIENKYVDAPDSIAIPVAGISVPTVGATPVVVPDFLKEQAQAAKVSTSDSANSVTENITSVLEASLDELKTNSAAFNENINAQVEGSSGPSRHEIPQVVNETNPESSRKKEKAPRQEKDARRGVELPPMSLLRHNPKSSHSTSSEHELEQTAQNLQATLTEFGLHSRVVGWIAGPTVTTFKVQPGEGERVNRIMNLEDDIALSLATTSVRIFAPIPNTSLVGIEIPNQTRQVVALGDVLAYAKGNVLELAIGRDSEGSPVVADLAKMPHLLIAGTTGSGKSVMINTIIMSILMRATPEDVRLIMVDPKRVELSGYNGLPHLYVPVVTEPKQAASALQWGVAEMERRLKIFERIGVRNIGTFNARQAAGDFESYDNPPAKMPFMVIIIDELSDLMMVAGKDVEASIVRIAQLGRAAGIHLIVATQRPSSDVVTGLIKANITNRIAFNVATGIDSRVIIDQMGAEKLIGLGDMLFSKVDWGKPKRIQGCFVSDDEINQAVDFYKEQGDPDYHEEILSAITPAAGAPHAANSPSGSGAASEDDPLVWDAAQIVVDTGIGSTSGLQRRLKVGYARAGRIMDMLEEKGIVGPPDGSKPRDVLIDAETLDELKGLEAQMSQDDMLF